jgi:hydrogenase maturation protease
VQAGKTLILGLGNPLVSDDSVGLRVVKELATLLADRQDVEVGEDYWGGLRLMERMVGFDRAIVIDAIVTGAEPGTILLLTPDDIPTQRSSSAHDVNLPTALELGRRSELKLPQNQDILLVAVEAKDVINFSEQCTPAVAAAVPRVVQTVLQALAEMTDTAQPKGGP